MRKILLILAVVQFTLAFGPNGIPFFKRKTFNLAGFLDIIKNSPLKLLLNVPKNKVKVDSTFQQLQTAYFNRQQALYSESRSLSGAIQEGLDEVSSSCQCAGNARCYSSCITKKLGVFNSYALLIGDTVQRLFCLPLGFGFETLYMSKHPKALMSFNKFVNKLGEHSHSFSSASLVAIWMSNLLWLDKSPLHLYSYIRSQLAVDIANNANQQNSSVSLIPSSSKETPAQFAAKCGTQWDLRKAAYSLVNAAKQKSHFLDVILPGLFAVRAAAFYTRGSYLNLAGGIMEALTPFIGRKCNIIAYSDGVAAKDANGDNCDGIGKYPIPQFPVPLVFSKLLSPCREYEGMVA